MWSPTQDARLKAIGSELETLLVGKSADNLTDKEFGRLQSLNREAERLKVEQRNYKAALGFAGSASPAEFGVTGDPGDFDNRDGYGTDFRWKSFGLPSAPQVAPPSLDISDAQIKSLFDAAKAGTPYKVQLGQKDFASSMRSKTAGAPLAESGLNNQLPAIQVPGPYGQYLKPYEPFRLLAAIPTVAMAGPSAAYLVHGSNTNNAMRVAEGQPKPSLGPVISENFVKPMKIAATVEATMEILQDHQEFAQWLPVALQQNVVNAESLALIQQNASSGPVGAEFNGLLATSGVLAQDGTGLSFADALSMAYVKIRTGASFSEPDLVLTSPATAAAALRSKSSTGAYIFDVVRGPGALNQQNEFDVFGVRTVTSSQCPDGVAIVMSIQGGACVGWIRMGLEIMYNPYGGTTDAGTDLWRTNQYSWRAEERVSLSVPRPSSICVVTNLPAT